MYCTWRGNNSLMTAYHDCVYGVLKTDSNVLFKWLSLEIMQAGLSWQTVINKENNFDLYYQNFDLNVVKNYDFDQLVQKIYQSDIIKNKLKLKSIIHNANIICFIEKNTTFFQYIKANIDTSISLEQCIDKMVTIFKIQGFKFIGFEIMKSFLESIGIIKNHDKECLYYKKPLFIHDQ